MPKFQHFISFFFAFAMMYSCDSTEERETVVVLPTIPHNFKTIKIDSLVTFACPKELLEVENLKLQGDYQFSDLINVQYAVIQLDSKETSDELDLKSFSSAQIDKLKLKMIDPSLGKLEQFSLNEIKGYTTEVNANVYGWPSKLHHWISIVELEDKFVTTITWTTENRVKVFEKDAEMIVKSFRMIN